MRTGRVVMRPGLPRDAEPHDRPLLAAVGEVGPAGDAVRLPVVLAGRVEPELGEVEELRPVPVNAGHLPRPADRLVAADEPVGVLRLRLADVDPDLPGTLRAKLEGWPLA